MSKTVGKTKLMKVPGSKKLKPCKPFLDHIGRKQSDNKDDIILDSDTLE
jgi:hypothetical protein